MWLGGDARLSAPIGLTVYLAVCAAIIVAGATIWTRRLHTQRCRELVLGAVNAASGAVIVTDARGTVTAMNVGAESITGWANSEAVGQPIGAVFRLVDARTRRPVVNPLGASALQKWSSGPRTMRSWSARTA